MRCQTDQCRSPLACSGFGYCRRRNFNATPAEREAMKAEWQAADNPPAQTGAKR